jgi:hypothetical protein
VAKMASRTEDSWHDEYRHGAFYLWPPFDVAQIVNEQRWQYDPKSAAVCDAHISLSEPLPAPLTNDQLTEIRTALATVQPFDVTYGPITSIGSHPGVVYAITPEKAFFDLRATIHGTSVFVGRDLPRAGRVPHMAIAEFISLVETHSLVARLRDTPVGAFRCDEVVYAAPDDSFHFDVVFRLPLGTDKGTTH